MSSPQIVIAGYGSEPVPQKLNEAASSLVRELSKRCDPVILVGGYWGVMKTVVDEALARNLRVVMVLPVSKCDVRVPGVISICTGMDFRERSTILVRSGDVVIALGGGIGTILEIALAYAYEIPAIVLRDTGMATDRLEDDWSPYVDERMLSRVYYTSSVSEAAEMACKSHAKP